MLGLGGGGTGCADISLGLKAIMATSNLGGPAGRGGPITSGPYRLSCVPQSHGGVLTVAPRKAQFGGGICTEGIKVNEVTGCP